MGKLTTTIQIPLEPTTRQQLEQLARIEDRPVAATARRLLLAALTAQKQLQSTEAVHGT